MDAAGPAFGRVRHVNLAVEGHVFGLVPAGRIIMGERRNARCRQGRASRGARGVDWGVVTA
jgi:hypothetical protein